MTALGESSFEWLRERLPSLRSAASEYDRELVWVDEGRRVAVSRDVDGHLEIFLPGPPLTSTMKTVAANLSHHQWWFQEGGALRANRLQFATAPHFDSFVSFLCAELIANGAGTDLPQAFARTEPSIALALARAALESEVFVGLAGELLLIDALTRAADAGDQRKAIMNAWAGSVPSSRDFRFGTTGVEVKTTSGASSKHHVQGLHQIEVGHADGGEIETGLFLLSLGLRWIDPNEGGTTVPSLVEAISSRLAVDDRDTFHQRLGQYGGDAGTGYRHDRDRFTVSYSRPFTSRFERLYDMGDPRIRLPTRGDLESFTNLDVDSLSFRIDLPARVHGDVNPLSGWQDVLSRLVRSLSSP